MQKLKDNFKQIQSYLQSIETEMFAFLKNIVSIQSSSHNKPGIDQTVDTIADAFKELPVTTETIKQVLQGNHLLIRSQAQPHFPKQVLLVGHMDTVFPEDTDFNWYKEDEIKSYGPGVVDMKGGLVVGIFALKALNQLGLLEQIPLTFVFNSDEEIGSRSSIDLIQKEANASAIAFVLEAGGTDNQVVTGRKGNLTIELHVQGKAGHAAYATKRKSSAILELAHKIIEFEALNDFEKGISINVGKIDGGIGPNTIPEFANAQIEFRYVNPVDLRFLEEKVTKIAETTAVPGTLSRVDFISGRPPMQKSEENRKLFEVASGIAKQWGCPLQEEFRNGVSDANFIADLNVPVLDGLGPIGGRDHSRDEFMIKQSLPQRTLLLACTILKSWETFGSS
jgi:glutamate carboxypeptidase